MTNQTTVLGWFRELWESTAELQSVLPVASIITGDGQDEDDDELPTASLSVESSTPAARSSDVCVRQTALQLKVWTEDHAWGESLGLLIEQHLDNVEDRSNPLTILSLRLANRFALQEEDGVWQFVHDFEVINQN